jgi:periplasmic divalent cation tolerance protein
MTTRSQASNALVVLVTCPNRRVGQRIGDTLVVERLAACVSVVPGLTSIYHWEGRIKREIQVLLVIKTLRGKLPAVTRRVRALHPDSIPEIIALPLVGGFPPYFAWLRESTR